MHFLEGTIDQTSMIPMDRWRFVVSLPLGIADPGEPDETTATETPTNTPLPPTFTPTNPAAAMQDRDPHGDSDAHIWVCGRLTDND